MKILTLGLFCITFQSSFSQIKDDCNVILKNWRAADCDNTFDPYRIKNRITGIETIDNVTIITVNFSENCCVELNPSLEFENNRLNLLPYTEYEGDYCECNCCFSISYEIYGLAQLNYETYFNGKRIEFSNEHYQVKEPTFEIYNGQEINKTNKYGFQEGIWMKFYESGEIKYLYHFPDQVLYYRSYPTWTKEFYESGALAYYNRNDSTERWFDDGQLQAWDYKYSIGDTAYKEGFALYDNHQLKKRYKEKSHIEKDTSTRHLIERTITDVFYHEEYYENGVKKYLYTMDTIFSWYNTGIIKEKEISNGRLEYNESGKLVKRIIHWSLNDTISNWNLSHSFYIEYLENGQIGTIHYVRDEVLDGGDSMAPSNHYYWKWNELGECYETPSEWTEDLPWIGFYEIKLPPTKNIRNAGQSR
ncbi:hypothetical protein [Seonamhaeicola maritimus]|uniref:hypothetical protein n=1 Tax=Seonamhaeicola maritimus TaxID=2591822 RepID=UPI0011C82F83|nr:hypothetical protein [Seonamhaeicola maritimus]